LADQSGHSKSKLYRIIDYWLSQGPPENNINLGRINFKFSTEHSSTIELIFSLSWMQEQEL
jgi:hypothetical protein